MNSWQVLNPDRIKDFFELNTSAPHNITVRDVDVNRIGRSLDSCIQNRNPSYVESYSFRGADDVHIGYVGLEKGVFRPKNNFFGAVLGYEALSLKLDQPLVVHTYIHGEKKGELSTISIPSGSVKLWAKIYGVNVSLNRRDHISKKCMGYDFNLRLTGDVPYFEEVPAHIFLQSRYENIPINPEPYRLKDKVRNVFYNPEPVTKRK